VLKWIHGQLLRLHVLTKQELEVRKPMWVVEVFSTRRNAWEQDGGDSAYSNT
jgi:hypothetical protein